MMLNLQDFAADFLQRTASQLLTARTPEALLEAASVYARGRGATAGSLVYAEVEAGEAQPRWRIVAEWSADGVPSRGLGEPSLEHTDSASARFFAHPNQPYFLEDAPNHPDLHPAVRQQCRDLHRQSMVLIPLKNQDRWVGLLGFFWRDPYTFTPDDHRVFSSVIYQIAPVIDALRLMEHSQRQAARLETLNRISAALTQAADEVGIVAALAPLVEQQGGTYIELEYQDVEEVRYRATSSTAEDDQCFLPATVARWQEGEGAVRTTSYQQMPPHSTFEYGIDDLASTEPDGPLFIENLLEDPRLSAEARARIAGELPSRALVFMQLRSGGRLQGNLAIAWSQPHPFTDDERAIYNRLRQTFSDVVASRRAYLAEQESRRESETLYRAGEAINRARAFEELLDALVSLNLAGDGVGISVFDTPSIEGASRLIVFSRARQVPEYVNLDLSLDDFPAVRHMLDYGRHIIVTDPANDPRLDPVSVAFYKQYGIQSVLGVALMVGGEFIGTLTLTAILAPHQFTERDIRQINGIANLVATAVERIRLQEQTLKAGLQAEKLAQVSAALAQATDEMGVVRALVPLAQTYGAAQMGLEYMDVAEALQMAAGAQGVEFAPAPVAIWLNGEVTQVTFGKSPLRSASDYGIDMIAFQNPQEPLFIENLLEDPRLTAEARERLGQEVISRALVYMALFSGGRLQGNISIAWRVPHTFLSEERAIFSALRQTLSEVVASRRSYLAEQEARQESDTLYRAGEAINGAQTYEGIMRAVATLGLKTDVIGMALHDHFDLSQPGGYQAYALQVIGPNDEMVHHHLRYEQHSAVKAFSAYDLLEILDVATDPIVPEDSRQIYLASGVKSMIGVTLRVGERALGGLGFHDYTARRYSAQEKRLLSSMADLISTAVERIRLQALAESGQRRAEKLAQVSAALAQAADETGVVRALVPLAEQQGASYIGLEYQDVTEARQATDAAVGTFVPRPVARWEDGQVLAVPADETVHHLAGELGIDDLAQLNPQEPLFIENILEDPRLNAAQVAQVAPKLTSHAFVYMSLWTAGRLQGDLRISWSAPRAFSEEERAIYTALRQTIGDVVASRRSYLAEQAARLESETLYRAGEAINRASTFEALIDLLVNLKLPGDGVGITLFDTPTIVGASRIKGIARYAAEDHYHRHENPLSDVPTLQFLPNAGVVSVTDPDTDPRVDDRTRAFYREYAMKSVLAVALMVGGEFIGALTVATRQRYVYSELDQRQLNGIANLVATAVARIRLQEQAVSGQHRAEKLAQISAALARAADQSSLGEAFGPYLQETGASMMSISYIDPEEMTEPSQSIHDVHQRYSTTIYSLWQADGSLLTTEYKPAGAPMFGGDLDALLRRDLQQIVYVEDMLTDPRMGVIYRTGFVASFGFRSGVYMPLFHGNRLQGYIAIGWREPHRFSEEEHYLYDRLKRTLAAHAEARRAYLAEEDARKESDVLYRAGEQINSAKSIEDIVEAVAALPLKTSLVALGIFENGDMDGATWQDVYLKELKPGAPINIRHLARESHPAGFAFRNRDMIVIEDTLTEPNVPEASRQIYLNNGVRALLTITLKIGERIIGGVGFNDYQPKRYTARDKRITLGLGGLVSNGVERIRLRHEAEAARRRAETLSHIHAAVSGSHDEASIVGALESFTSTIGAHSMTLRYVDCDEEGMILRSWLVAEWKEGRVRPISTSERQPNFPMQEWWGKVVGGLFVSEDIQTDARISPAYRDHLAGEGIASMASLLLYGGGGMQALLSVFWQEPHTFSLDEQHIFSQLTRTLPTVVATRRAFLAEQQRARQLETVAKVSAAVTGRLDRDELLQTLTEMTEVSFENFHMEIFLLDEMRCLVQATHVARGLPRLEIDLTEERSLIARAARQRQPVRADDITSLSGWSLAPLIPNARAELAVPMTLGERLIGVLVVQSTEAGRFSETDSWVMSTLADLLSVAIQNADLYAQAQEGAAYEERNRLARELHDSVSQALYGIALGTKTARALLDRDPSKLKEPLDYILQLADAGLMEMRALIFDLRKDSLQEEGLLAALTRQTDSLGARYGFKVEKDFCEEPVLPLTTKEGIYWVAREALHNIVKHAKATRIDLALNCDERALWLEIRDNGLGFDASADFKGHMGLGNMRERTSRLGGTLEIESVPGAGTLVRVRVPRLVGEVT